MRCRVRMLTAVPARCPGRERVLMVAATPLAWTVIGWAAAAGRMTAGRYRKEEERR